MLFQRAERESLVATFASRALLTMMLVLIDLQRQEPARAEAAGSELAAFPRVFTQRQRWEPESTTFARVTLWARLLVFCKLASGERPLAEPARLDSAALSPMGGDGIHREAAATALAGAGLRT